MMPAYNAEKTLETTVNNIPGREKYDLILVDDCSTDDTLAIAKRLGLETYKTEKNLGYGGNQKLCYKKALEKGAEIVIMLHPDYQYEPKVIPLMAGIIEQGVCDVVLGNRIRTRREALEGGMPVYKYVSNRFLTAAENVIAGQNLGEWHSGLRAYSSRVLKTINWETNSDDFVFDTQFLFQCVNAGFRIGDIPVPVKYFEEASSINFSRSLKYGLSTLGVAGRYFLHSSGLLKSALFEAKEK